MASPSSCDLVDVRSPESRTQFLLADGLRKYADIAKVHQLAIVKEQISIA